MIEPINQWEIQHIGYLRSFAVIGLLAIGFVLGYIIDKLILRGFHE